jgi:hypothetical protein
LNAPSGDENDRSSDASERRPGLGDGGGSPARSSGEEESRSRAVASKSLKPAKTGQLRGKGRKGGNTRGSQKGGIPEGDPAPKRKRAKAKKGPIAEDESGDEAPVAEEDEEQRRARELRNSQREQQRQARLAQVVWSMSSFVCALLYSCVC